MNEELPNDQLTCDVCARECDALSHSRDATEKHKHVCDGCWAVMQAASDESIYKMGNL